MAAKKKGEFRPVKVKGVIIGIMHNNVFGNSYEIKDNITLSGTSSDQSKIEVVISNNAAEKTEIFVSQEVDYNQSPRRVLYYKVKGKLSEVDFLRLLSTVQSSSASKPLEVSFEFDHQDDGSLEKLPETGTHLGKWLNFDWTAKITETTV